MNTIKKYRLELDAEKHPVLLIEEEYKYQDRVTTPEMAAKLCNLIYRLEYAAEEHLVMLALNAGGRVLGVFEISHGTVLQSICNAREIYLRALLVGASSIILVHNHPGGNLFFSKSDLLCSRKIKKAGELIGIVLQDFIIICENGSYLSESEMLETDE